MKFSRNLFGSKLNITINSPKIDNELIEKCFLKTEQFEKKYSRFIEDNYLYKLNKDKSSKLDLELLSIIKLCNRISDLTEGYFDITILPLLENIGYGIEKNILKENIGYKNIEISGDKIILNNDVSIDIGSVGKGYMVDKIFKMLELHYNDFIIDFGGDIKVKGSKKIFLEDPSDEKKVIGSIVLDNLSIASSSGNKRNTKKGHHLINAINKESQNDKLSIFVTHKLSCFSDIFSTALFVCPLEKSIDIFNKINGLEGLIITDKGEIFKSSGFNCELNKK